MIDNNLLSTSLLEHWLLSYSQNTDGYVVRYAKRIVGRRATGGLELGSSKFRDLESFNLLTRLNPLYRLESFCLLTRLSNFYQLSESLLCLVTLFIHASHSSYYHNPSEKVC